jgi:DNA-binding response OmpR family regulator
MLSQLADYSVILVDGSDRTLKIEKSMLQKLGFGRVLTATSLTNCLAVVASDPKPDLVVTDITLADATGIELLKAIRIAQTPLPADTPVLMMTAKPDPQQVALAREYHLNALLVKPFAQQQLTDRVEACLRTRIAKARAEAVERGMLLRPRAPLEP